MTQPSASEPVIPGIAELFMGFFMAGISGFGGVLPFARRMIVEERRWLTPAEFTEMWSLCQFLPGPNIINMSLALGMRYRGLPGAAACMVGLAGAPFLIMVGIGALYTQYGYVLEVRAVLRGIAAVAAGLFVAMAFKMAGSMRERSWLMSFALLSFAGIGLLRLPLAAVLLTLAPLSIGFAWLRARRKAAVP
jgi:chromate transporter